MQQVKKAIQSGADVNAKDEDGACPLGLAAGHGHVNIVRTLIKAGADIDWEAPRGQTALHVAALSRHTEVVRTLIFAGADVNARIQSKKAPEDFQSATPLLMAVRGRASSPERTEPKTIEIVRALKVLSVRSSGTPPEEVCCDNRRSVFSDVIR